MPSLTHNVLAANIIFWWLLSNLCILSVNLSMVVVSFINDRVIPYSALVSMAPLSQEVQSISSCDPPHIGQYLLLLPLSSSSLAITPPPPPPTSSPPPP